jgi:L-rhamnose mutarotase
MIRKAFILTVHAGHEKEYARRHQPIWEELVDVLKSHGVHNYSIFLEPGSGRCFAYVEVEDEARWNQIASTEVCRRWWAHMAEIMETNPDNSPRSTPLVEVFHLD